MQLRTQSISWIHVATNSPTMAPALQAIRYERGQVRVQATTLLGLRSIKPDLWSLLIGMFACSWKFSTSSGCHSRSHTRPSRRPRRHGTKSAT